MRFFAFILVTLLLSSELVSAATDTFNIRTFVGTDSTPPTVPSFLTATPVATTQINLSWGTSTDDFLLSGYQVFRDDIQIATTTDTFYSDVGLTPSTTYAYYVTAFDSFRNISASSSVVSTTTLAPPPPPPSGATSTEESRRNYGSRSQFGGLTSLEITPSEYGAVVRVATDGFMRIVVRWGTTISYELGSSAVRTFAEDHVITIGDLRPNTTYRLYIEGEDNRGRRGVLTETTFTTLSDDGAVPPGNVMNLIAERLNNDVVLSWENPRDTDFDRVRVVRGRTFYPTDSADGWVVYEGTGETALDSDVFLKEKEAFYTVFSYDTDGNVSSGAVVYVGAFAEVPPLSTDNPINLQFNTIEFYQENELLVPYSHNALYINGGKHLTLAIPYTALPEHLKAILVTITPQAKPDTHLSFLLRVNPEKTAYTARLAPLGTAGNFNVRISVFDFKTQQIAYTEGVLHSEISTYFDEEDTIFLTIILFIREYFLWIFILLVLISIIARRRTRPVGNWEGRRHS